MSSGSAQSDLIAFILQADSNIILALLQPLDVPDARQVVSPPETRSNWTLKVLSEVQPKVSVNWRCVDHRNREKIPDLCLGITCTSIWNFSLISFLISYQTGDRVHDGRADGEAGRQGGEAGGGAAVPTGRIVERPAL